MLTHAQITRVPAYRQRGFSMIDVLIAILVLAIGLLALGVLQGALTRNAADARIRSQVAAYSQGITDMLRSQGYNAFPASSTVTANSTACASTTLTSLQTYACNWLNGVGLNSVSTRITSTRYYGSGGTSWSQTPPTGLSGATPQYKQVNVATTWTDSQGQTRTLAYDTAVSTATVNPADGSLDQKSFSSSSTVSPQVRESSPGNIPGVIPIAIGSTSSGSTINSAATNPQPVVTNTGTTFSQYTYHDSSLGGELITQRVDTKVIQCRCKFAVGTGTGGLSGGIPTQPNQPTYWDGYHYVSPAANNTIQVTTSGSGTATTYASNTSVDSAYASTNDTDCDVCCRDRNDSGSASHVPVATSTNPVLFDSFSGDNQKYVFSTTTNSLQAVTSGSFQQACRLIRVDGVYATATDAHVDFFNLLSTGSCSQVGLPTTCASTSPATTGSQTGAVPLGPSSTSTTTEGKYSSFVENYLTTNVSSLSSSTGVVQSTWGIGSPQTTSGTGSAAASSFNGLSLNLPANVTIDPSATYFPWLYARALYVDHVEPAAQTAISNATTGCTGTHCVLQYVPFTTVNLSGLGNNVPGAASSSPASVIIVSNTSVVGGAADGSAPNQGYVTPYSTTVTGTANAIYTSFVTNSSLTGVSPTYSGSTLNSTPANSPYDTTTTLFDRRQFTVGTSATCTGSPVYFDANLGGLTWLTQASSLNTYNSNFGVSWTGPFCGSGSTTGYLTPTSTYPVLIAGGSATTPIAVATDSANQTAPVGITIKVAGFNTSSAVSKQYGSQTFAAGACTPKNSTSSSNTTPVTFTTATQCYNYAVSSVSQNGTPILSAPIPSANLSYSETLPGGMQQMASITFPSGSGISSTTNTITGADNVVIQFSLYPGSPSIASGTCQCTNRTCSQNTYTAGTCSN